MNKLLIGVSFALLLTAVPTGALAEEPSVDSEADADHFRVTWVCGANNVKGGGPYWGYGRTQPQAQAEALRVCRMASVFRCWPVPNSCSPVR